MFDLSLYDKLKEAIPKKDKYYIDELAKKVEEAEKSTPVEPTPIEPIQKENEIKEPDEMVDTNDSAILLDEEKSNELQN
jgi:hypothetical protein